MFEQNPILDEMYKFRREIEPSHSIDKISPIHDYYLGCILNEREHLYFKNWLKAISKINILKKKTNGIFSPLGEKVYLHYPVVEKLIDLVSKFYPKIDYIYWEVYHYLNRLESKIKKCKYRKPYRNKPSTIRFEVALAIRRLYKMKEFTNSCGESSYSKNKLTRELNTLKDWWRKGNILDFKGIEVYCNIFNRPIKLKRKQNEWCL